MTVAASFRIENAQHPRRGGISSHPSIGRQVVKYINPQIISMAEWKAAHPPVLICWQHGLACAVAWHELWLKVFLPRQR